MMYMTFELSSIAALLDTALKNVAKAKKHMDPDMFADSTKRLEMLRFGVSAACKSPGALHVSITFDDLLEIRKWAEWKERK